MTFAWVIMRISGLRLQVRNAVWQPCVLVLWLIPFETLLTGHEGTAIKCCSSRKCYPERNILSGWQLTKKQKPLKIAFERLSKLSFKWGTWKATRLTYTNHKNRAQLRLPICICLLCIIGSGIDSPRQCIPDRFVIIELIAIKGWQQEFENILRETMKLFASLHLTNLWLCLVTIDIL